MRERGGNSWRMREKEWGNNKNSNFLKFQIIRESLNRGRERIVQLLKACVSSRGATF